MKRLHIHVSVRDLEASIRFYGELFAAQPTVRKPDYAKWMLEDPRVNFAISRRESQRGAHPGVQHLGIQVEDRPGLEEVYARLKRAEGPVVEEGATTCCYAESEKSWIDDPQGVPWEVFLTTGESTVYGTDQVRPAAERKVTAHKAEAACAAQAREAQAREAQAREADPPHRAPTCCSPTTARR